MTIDMKNNKILLIILVALILIFGAYFWRGNIQNLLSYGSSDWPTHDTSEGCDWVKTTFSKITLFEQSCSDPSLNARLSENSDGTVVQTETTKYGYSFKLQLFTKTAAQNPSDILNEWYAKLTLDERKVCEIQNADEPVDHFSDGRLHWTENPHPAAHKIRLKIALRPETVQQISDKFGGDPGSGSGYDYMCGHLVGTTWSGHPPYFEFDDRSPDKYLLVGSYGFEGPIIDLNSIRF
jgi:hypothetical protein